MRELEIDDNIRSTHFHGLLQFQLPSFASLSAHVRNLHNPPSDGIHLLFRMGGKLSLPFLFTSRRFFLFLSLLGSSSRLFPVWKSTSLQLLVLLLLLREDAWVSEEETHFAHSQTQQDLLLLLLLLCTICFRFCLGICCCWQSGNLEAEAAEAEEMPCWWDENWREYHHPLGLLFSGLLRIRYFALWWSRRRKEEKCMMVFNGALLLEFAGWAVKFCQVLACNPEVLGRSEVWDMLCCVPLHLLARAFRLLFSAFRVRLLPHNDWTSKNLLQLGSKQSRAFFSINFYFISLQQNSYLGFIVSSVQTLTIQIPSCFVLSFSLSNLYTQQQQLRRVSNESLAPDPILLLETSLSL